MINQADLSGKLALDANGLNNLRQAAKDNSPEAIKATAQQFEAMFMNMMLKSMRDATPQDGPFDSEQSRSFTSMLDQQLSQHLATKGIGLAEVLARQLTKTSGIPQETPAPKKISSNNFPYLSQQSNNDSTSPAASLSSAPAPSLGTQSDHVKAFQQTMAAHAQEASQMSGIPAQFMIGQAALESGWGKREIKGADGTPSNNLFGIKATGSWSGKVVETVTTEYVHGEKQKKVEKFRAYDSYADSFKDFASLISNNPRYGNVISNVQEVAGYAQALQKAGYATDPNYADKLMRVIQMTSSA